jgi:hypothetical protein
LQKQISSAVLFLGGLRYRVTNPLFFSHLQKVTPAEPSKSGCGQTRLLSIGAGFGG